jgi:hypothetical protein
VPTETCLRTGRQHGGMCDMRELSRQDNGEEKFAEFARGLESSPDRHRRLCLVHQGKRGLRVSLPVSFN